MKKRTLTLLEIMIVIVLIGIIGSVIGVNMKGSLDKGRAFKTEHAQQQIQDILSLAVAKGASVNDVVSDPRRHLEESGLVKDPDKFLNDGWGHPFEISGSDEQIVVRSDALRKFKKE